TTRLQPAGRRGYPCGGGAALGSKEASVRVWLVSLLAGGAALAAAGSAQAQLLQSWRDCVGDGQAGPLQQINGCSEVIRSGLETPPHLAVAFYNRGVVLQGQGEIEHAIADYDRAAQLDPTLPDPLAARGAAHFAKADFAGALADYDAALRTRPANVDALIGRGAAHAALDDVPAAIADYDRALEIAPSSTEALEARGLAHAKLGEPERAAADESRAIAIDPRDAAAYRD